MRRFEVRESRIGDDRDDASGRGVTLEIVFKVSMCGVERRGLDGSLGS